MSIYYYWNQKRYFKRLKAFVIKITQRKLLKILMITINKKHNHNFHFPQD